MTVFWQLVHILYPGQVPGVLGTLAFLAQEGALTIAENTVLTLARTAAGFLIGATTALALGLLYTLGPLAKETVRALNTVLQSVSVLVWSLVLVMLFGVLSPIPPVLVAALVALPIMLSALLSGLESANPRLIELAILLGADRKKLYKDFLLPSLLPALAGAGRAALGAALRISVVAEAFGSSGGIGYMIATYYSLAEPRGVFAWGLVLVTLMIVLDKLVLEHLEERIRRWAALPR
ncbi:ABC-type nitrate/sulfonate/bicarbonate transport system, periplasmic component [Pyrodictium delaneyi]|uniref:ABC-type nitrate/sulfonate/bicarbonate transport system, periplasmic component n=1 Tax=Pyrodictium delaneyi TaxID=1273541 RepID=A0A0P0N281_9CREN|nr:ABC transporter permease subunit [Pyrodictium delaneyi]ALL00404.1 ABC-type nitrate/sulfonate/bicarbonate transport system, periplasmic component [Pyrodictium delaneyi]